MPTESTTSTSSSSSVTSSSFSVVSSPVKSTSETPTQDVQEPEAAPAEQQAPVDEPPAGPTFDPNSGDGYGLNQALPPFCERFPHDQSCQPPAAADECVGFGCSPEQDAELAEVEGDVTARFWDCIAAGGTEQTCLQ